MEKQLKKLTKDQLVKLAADLLTTHQKYYEQVEKNETNVTAGFYMFAGASKSIRECYHLPALIEVR